MKKYTEEQQARLEQGKVAQAKFNDLMDYYTLWVHQIKTPIAASQLLVQDVRDAHCQAADGTGTL